MVGVTGQRSKNSKAVRELKGQGNKAMQSGAFQKAVRTYTKALELDPGNAILYSNRSAAHFNLREYAESLQDAESAILCDASLWKAYKRKGLALIHMQRYEEAISALEHGITLVGKNVEMEKNLEFARACQEQAQNLYILPEPHMMQRLESVPVFIVTDLVGQPFFVTYDDGQQVCTFYFDKQDAVATLDWIKSENPDLGDTARVIHITLNQAFNLAQETQKQYYEETTRAAAEEDRRLAQEAEAKAKADKEASKKGTAPALADSPKEEEQKSEESSKDDSNTTTESSETKDDKPDSTAEVSTEDKPTAETTGDAEAEKTSADADGEEKKDAENKEADDAIIDENAPLSFQFRPELRQVQIAVELLNKTPNPRVRPILRDPPSVRKAKAEAAAAAAKEAEEKMNAEEAKESGEKADEGDEKKAEEPESADKAAEEDKKEEELTETTEGKEAKENGDATDNAGKDTEDAKATEDDSSNNADGDDENMDDVELTVDNFNGIPIFQAKGMTLLQKSRQLIPLFFSKWDLETAWEQLKGSNLVSVPDEIEIEVGTLEDVLRRMSENKTEELDSVFFVPSRESMKAINVKFPLDDFTGPANGVSRPAVRKAGFSKAKQIAARGGTKDEIRAAIREDLDKYTERKKMAEVISQIEHARRTGGVGVGGPAGSGSGTRGAKKAGGITA